MPAIRIPRIQGNWTGQYQGDYFGDIRRSANIDLERSPGKIELSEVTEALYNDATFRRVEAFARVNLASDSGVRYYAMTFDSELADGSRHRIFRSTDSDGSSWAADTVTTPGGTSRSYQDMVNFPNPADTNTDRLFASLNDTSVAWHTGVNDTIGWVADTTYPFAIDSGEHFHPLDVFEGTLLVGSKNAISTLDNADSGVINERVTIPAQFWMHHILHTPSSAWILASNSNFEGMISEWDGYSLLPIRNQNVSAVPISGVDYHGTPVVLLADGRFLAGEGSSFRPIRDSLGRELALPVAKEKGNSLLGQTTFPLDPSKFAVARRGMIVDGDNIKFNLAKSTTEIFGEFKQNSGIWVLNPRLGLLYNTASVATAALTGEDFGQTFVPQSGALLKNPDGGIKFSSTGGYNNFSATINATINRFRDYDDSTLQIGFLEIQWLNIPQADASWQSFWVKHRKFADTNVKILAKARIEEGPFFLDSDVDLPNIAQVDFDDDTAFQVLLSTTGDSLVVGDEIEVLAGPNAGKLAHITAISGAHGANQTFTIDETFDSSASLSAATFGRWVKLTLPNGDSAITHGDSEVVHQFIIPGTMAHSPKISIKLEMRGRARDVSIEELALEYKVSEEFEK